MLRANIDGILTPPPCSTVLVGIDGLWGPHEWTIYPQLHSPAFPYLTWILLCLSNSSAPHDVLTCSIDKSMWQAHPSQSNIHVINLTVLDKLTVRWDALKEAMQTPFHDIVNNPCAPIQCPMNAYTRVFEAFSQLNVDFGAWQDFVEVL